MAQSTTVNAPDTHDDTSCDLFEGLDNEIVPETEDMAETQLPKSQEIAIQDTPLTQMLNTDDSGESVRIPFYDKKNTSDSELSSTKCTNDSDDESEYVQVHPESNLMEPVEDEPQSQFIMANMDRSLIRDLGESSDHASSERDDSTLTENNSTKENSRKNDNSEKQSNDRSGSTTPDLDFLTNAGQESSKNTKTVEPNDENGDIPQNSQSIFDVCTQLVTFDRADSPEETTTDKTFAMPTHQAPVFKLPAAISSTPNPKSKPNRLDESIYDADTQMAQEDDEFFEEATQVMPPQKPSTVVKSNMNRTDSQASKRNKQDEPQQHGNSGKFLVEIFI